MKIVRPATGISHRRRHPIIKENNPNPVSKYAHIESTHHAAPINFDWANFAQVELRHRQSLHMLREAVVEAERTEKATRPAKLCDALNVFSAAARRNTEERRSALETLANIDRRIKEEQLALFEIEHRLHDALHAWLMESDPEYKKSAEIDGLCQSLGAHITPIANRLAELLCRYGATRNEIAISYNHELEAMSPAAHASLSRLIDSYTHIVEAGHIFTRDLDRLNALVSGTMFERLKLCQFTKAVAPDCHAKMTYVELRANFEAGADQARAALEQLRDYVGAIESVNARKACILFEYRAAKWRAYLQEIREVDDTDAGTGEIGRASA